MKNNYNSLRNKTLKEITLENTTLNEINYSSKRITKYFKDQRPYEGTEQFVDPFFPPSARSIFGKNEDGTYVDPNQDRVDEALADFQFDDDEIVWKRPGEIFGPDYAVFEGKIEFDDVRQGSIGNCYFMASISALTECPQIIAEIFRHHDVQKNGRYEVVLKLDGEWQVVILDDMIPCNKMSGKPMFANPKGAELWAVLLEKAWAKVNGGYALTVAGMASEVIECLTNFPYEYNMISADDSDDKRESLWAKIIEASGNEFIMTTALPPKDGAEALGLVEGHEYTLESGQEENIDGERVRLCKVRNPWGSINFKGDWGINSDKWTDEAKEKFNYKETYDGEGEFFIHFDDFLNFFADVDVCKISSNICLKQVKLSYEDCKVPSVYELHVFKPSQVDLTLFKPYYRFNRNLPSDWFMTQHIFVGKCEDEEQMTFSKFYGQVEGQNDCSLSAFLEPGSYFIIVWANYSSAKDYDAPLDQDLLTGLSSMFSAYASEFIDLHPKGQDYNMSVFSRMALSFARQNEELCSTENNLMIYQGNNWMKSEFYFIYYKSLLDQNIEFTFDDSNSVGLVSHCTTKSFTMRPGQEYIYIAGCPDIYEGHVMGVGYGYGGTNNEGTDSLLFPLINLPECPDDHKNIALYKWIYKKGEVDYNNILKEINPAESAFAHFKFKYPKEVEEILSIPKLDNHDSLKLQVLDKIDFGEGDWYLGESKAGNEITMYGRGMAKLGEDIYVGQFVNHSMTGTGYLKYPDGSRLNSKFEDFRPVGKGSLTKNDGKVVSVNN